MKEEIKSLRVKIDGLHKLTLESNINFIGGSREMDTAADKLIYAKAWLGKCLQEQGVESPYKAGYKTVEDIEPTADVNNEVPFGDSEGSLWRDKNHIEKVDWLRTEIDILANQAKDLITLWQSREFSIARTNAYNYLCEAKFWLGFELQRIKEENNRK